MRTAICSRVLGSMLLLFLAAPRSEATAVFDFSGVCASGDCDPGSTVTGELRFSDDADLSHRSRLVTGADFVSLALGFATVGKARATARWSPASEGGIIQPIEVAIDTAGELKALSLRDDLLNTFQLDEAQPSGSWRYRQIQLTPEGQLAIDLTFAGNAGFFVRRRTAVPEPTATTLLSLGFGLALLHRRGRLKG